MKNALLFLLLMTPVLVGSCGGPAGSFEQVEFKSGDGLTITADWFPTDPGKPFVLLCHQARYSRGEYRKTAAELNSAGYNCLAIDQRSGQSANGIENETNKRAAKQGLPTEFRHAEQDIRAAIDYLFEKAGNQPIIIVGSSYSAALVCKIGPGNEKVSKIVAFSPGEYIKGSKIGEALNGLDKPLFVTSSKQEAPDVKKLVKGAKGKLVTQFIPGSAGKHGSKALWEGNANHDAYWEAFLTFLQG